MPRAIRHVDETQIVRDHADLFISYGGQAKQVAEVYVAKDGYARQCWPPTEYSTYGILMDTDTLETYDIDESLARAVCTWDAQTGRILYTTPDGDAFFQAINPPPRAKGQFLYKFEVVSGDIVTHDTPATWYDVLDESTVGVFENYLLNSLGGVEEGEATLSFAVDDGVGAPLAGTTVSKTIDFKAEVTSGNIRMSTRPWILSNTETNEPAEVFIVTVPDGWYDPIAEENLQNAYVNGEFGFPKGIQESEVMVINWNALITVRVDVISGAVLGDATGVDLSTDVRRIWYINADDPLDVEDAVVDLTITDGSESVTKRITLHAEQLSEGTTSTIDEEFTRFDSFYDSKSGSTFPITATVDIAVKPDGYVYAETLNLPDPATFPQKWNIDAGAVLDPENFECRLTLTSGTDPTGTMDTWLNCASVQEWGYSVSLFGGPFDPIPGLREQEKVGNFKLEIREVGRPDTVKTKVFQMYAIVELV